MAVHDFGFCDKCSSWHDMGDESCIRKELSDLRETEKRLRGELAQLYVDAFFGIVFLAIKVFGFYLVWIYSHSWIAMIGALLIDIQHSKKAK